MFSDSKTIQMLEKLGFTIGDSGMIERVKTAKEGNENYTYCGFNVYLGDSGDVFEKVADEYIAVTSDANDAEKRFIARHMAAEND